MKKLTRKIIKTTMTKQKAKLSEKDLWDEVLLIRNFLFEYICPKTIFLILVFKVINKLFNEIFKYQKKIAQNVIGTFYIKDVNEVPFHSNS